MNSHTEAVKLKRQMLEAFAMVIIAFVALTSATYAWYVSNHRVKATTSTISAIADDVVLQISKGTVPEHGSSSATIAAQKGHPITPASTDDIVNWYVPERWVDNLTKVDRYQQPIMETMDEYNVLDGSYQLGGKTYYAYVASTFTLYSIKDTGTADVYLDGSAEGGAIQITRLENGVQVPVTDKVAATMRVGIVIDGELKFVYAPKEPDGLGNDVYSINNNIQGWTSVADGSSTKSVTYAHISGAEYSDWAIYRKDGTKYYDAATAGRYKVAENVGYDGVRFQIYVWMEGTDSDCIGSVVSGDESEYSVVVHLAGLATK